MPNVAHPTTHNPWLQLRREVRSGVESFAAELPPGEMDKRGFDRVIAFAKAMFFRMTPVRRAVLIVAIVMLASSFVLAGDRNGIVAASRVFAGAACLLVLLGLELADRVALKRDLELAREIQASLLPDTPPEWPGLDIAFGTRPANTVAGDYYDVLEFGESKLFAVVDVAGKGIPAGLLMAGFRSCLHALAGSATGLRELAAGLHRYCCEDSGHGRHFTTAVLAAYDAAAHTIGYVNAGQNPPILRRASGLVELLDATGVPFGTFAQATQEVRQAAAGPGDLLLLYTDGLVEAVNDAGEEYGIDQLLQFVRETHAGSGEFRHELISSIDAFTGQAPQHDDMTCLVVQFLGKQLTSPR